MYFLNYYYYLYLGFNGLEKIEFFVIGFLAGILRLFSIYFLYMARSEWSDSYIPRLYAYKSVFDSFLFRF